MFEKKETTKPFIFEMLKSSINEEDWGMFIAIECELLDRGGRGLENSYSKLLEAEFGKEVMAVNLAKASMHAAKEMMKKTLKLSKLVGVK